MCIRDRFGNAPYLRARILARQRRFHEARACLATIDRASDVDVAALAGAIALGLGDVSGAIAHLRTSIAARPTYEAARNLSTALEATGDRAGALHASAAACRAPARSPVASRAVDRFRAASYVGRAAMLVRRWAIAPETSPRPRAIAPASAATSTSDAR